ncbi:RING zinc finger protein, putative [Talaromyces stipitatus ATCC 10500]|uniref:E3 ubiquitin-protein ligase listerin n=1 Tax=Talaromyces stipitatus (strain ATCC 10500 / CBS 375.48 / QM 6759 / NRRL 1006) TaxID=441959 RepID=B8M0T1_TALSN|nr:RING zinc finger protein, putative [Talaromyces stipitatus ATCC 10500]EED21464.1 RING zinc finger protein, putative [Talaromyces stipitatus ATCC 10500]
MSKKFKSQASSSRAAAGGFTNTFGGFSSGSSSLGTAPSSLSYAAEPPDLSRISDPNLVVAFKNLTKKDDITKTKALEDIKDAVLKLGNRSDELEEGFLEAWTKVYPRNSIENARRVRQLAHTIQGLIASLAGKRVARHLPKVVGAWLAGLYDNDRHVSRSVVESISQIFSTDEKRNGLWKVFQSSVLEFVEDVILHQTALTLSDERIVKPDDAEAKFARVSATALLLFNRILSTASPEQIAKDRMTIRTILNSKNLWSFTHHADPFVRRSIYSLLRSSLAQVIEDLDWRMISSSIISQALPTSQLGSATEFSETLLQLSQNRPQLWTTDFTGKTDASKRLHQYIKRGSQGAAELYWSNLAELLQVIPTEMINCYGSKGDNETPQIGLSQAKALMNDLLTGLTSRDEPRHNLKTGWAAYYDIGIWLSTLIPENERGELVTEFLTMIFDPYVNGHGEHQWIPPSIASATCTVAFLRLTNHGYDPELRQAWEAVTQNLLQAVKLSLPEQSKDFRSSQDGICTKATQYFKLEAAVLWNLASQDNSISSLFEESSLLLLKGSLQVLQARNGKPYGAAAIVEEAVRHVPEFIKDSKDVINDIRDAIPQLLSTPSADRIMSVILMCSDWEGFESVFNASLETMTEATPQSSGGAALQKLLSTVDFQKVQESAHFVSIVSSSVEKAIEGNSSQWPFVFSVIENKTAPNEMIDNIVTVLVHGLSSDEETVISTLSGLSSLGGEKPEALKRLRNGKEGSRLVARLLYLIDSPTEGISQKAEDLEKKLRETVSADVTSASTREILKHELQEVGPQSLSFEVLSGMARDLIRNTESKDLSPLLTDIFPSYELWKTYLEPFLRLPIRHSTSIMSPLGGTVYLVANDLPGTGRQDLENIQRDSDDASSVFRLAYYVVRILSSQDVLVSLDAKQREGLFYYLPLALQLIDDDVSIEGSIGIAGLGLLEDRNEALETVSEGRSTIRKWIQSEARLVDGSRSVSEDLLVLWEEKVAELDNTSPESYRIGQAYAKIMSEAELTKTSDALTSLAREIRKYNPIRAAAELAVWGPALASSSAGTRLCSELIADATGFKPGKTSEGPKSIVFFNILAQSMRESLDAIPTQRMVFLVKNLVYVLQSSPDSTSVKTEAFKALSVVLRPLFEIYGSHWAESIDALCSTWTEIGGGDAWLPLLHSSLRLFAVLRDLVKTGANDDLTDAWKDYKQDLFESLISTLNKLDSSSVVYHPRDITADLLRRELVHVPIDSLTNKNEMFSLLAVECKVIQQTAFELLHRHIPQAQEQVSFDVALSKTTVNLPDELLSLLLEVPQANLVTSLSDTKTWLRIRSYLLSWKLVFDHFSNASLPVQENYAENIKEHQILTPLLEFTFDFLQKSHGKLVDASKFDIRSWEPIEDPGEQDSQWLLIHLYYLSLKHLSLFTKNWWIDSKKRIKGPVETWTQKYITPSIIEDALTGVSTWIQTQEEDYERPLSVKVSHRAAEIIASIPVDEDSPPVAMAISLPPAYPLQPAIVTGRSRVLVDEKKWRSWMLIIQGVIMFSNGNLVDGLLAFRRNVQGALKGQSECAICYSVISTDMQTPNKRCATCKNAFHSVCLFRWFKSSNQSTCPLCRNNFVYV